MPDPAFKIDGKTYGVPQRFRMGDAVLVRELTGLEFAEFAERLDEAQEDPDATPDMVVLTGLIGVAVWQSNPKWDRDRVRRFVEDVDVSTFSFEGDDADPPDQGQNAPKPSPDTSAAFTSTQVPSADEDPS